MSEPERQPDPVAELLQGAVALNELERAQARAAFLRRVDGEEERAAKAMRIRRHLVPLALAAAVVALFWLRTSERTLDYVVQGAISQGGYIRAQERSAEITFSDETRMTASVGTRLRIDERARDGARVSVERGRLQVAVTHTGRSDWLFAAGPFRVRVTGTRFDLAWDAEAERLEVQLHEGSVDVEGYSDSGVVSVRAGQRFVGDARQKTMLVSNGASPPSSEPGSATTQEPAVLPRDAPTTKGAAPSSAPSAPAPAPTSARVPWAKLVSKGEFQRVVDEATARGTKSCLSSCDVADLSALADAARYTGRSDLAEQALLALRQRDAQASGSRAAFLLGRLHEGRGNAARAKSWYETSLSEAPSGAFAAESLVGKMRTVSALEGRAAARPIAREYLRRYPTGVHAATAKQIAGGP